MGFSDDRLDFFKVLADTIETQTEGLRNEDRFIATMLALGSSLER